MTSLFIHKKISGLAALALCLALASGPARAAVPAYLPYPSESPVLINPYGEGDESALLIQAMQPFFQVIEGRSLKELELPGRGGATAWGELADKEGDGYTLAVTNLQSLILQTMRSRPVFKMEQLFNSNVMASAPLVLWVPQNSPFPRLGELLRSAKAYPNQLIIAGAGSASQTHLATLRLNFLAGIQTIYLPYVGTGMAMDAAKLGQAHAAWGFALPEYGKMKGMRPLAVAAEKRLENMPDVPTFEEAKVALFESAHFGLAIPAGTPGGTRQAVAAHFGKIFGDKAFQDAIAAHGFTPLNLDPQAVGDLMRSERERLSDLTGQFKME